MTYLKVQVNILPYIGFKIYLSFRFYYSVHFILVFEQLHLNYSLKTIFFRLMNIHTSHFTSTAALFCIYWMGNNFKMSP